MRKERIMAIIGIVFPVICFFHMATISDSGKPVPTILPVGSLPYLESIQNLIWAKTLIIIFVMFFCQLFYYITYLNEGVKSKIKSFVVLSIIGLVLSIGLLISGIGGAGVYFSFINMSYSIIFSIVMLIRSLIVMIIRSFKKSKELKIV